MGKRYLFGSKILGLDNCHDEDWYAFFDTKSSNLENKNDLSIPLYNAIIGNFIKGKNMPADHLKATFLYQYSTGFHSEEDYLFNYFNILEHKSVWIDCLKSYINSEKAEQYAFSGNVLPKRFYHFLYQYYMIIENTHLISDKTKVNVQKIHDLEMPSSYFYELRDLINNLY